LTYQSISKLPPSENKIIIAFAAKYCVKVRCPDCKGVAEMGDNFSFVKCSNCGFDMVYGDYIKYIAHKDARYRDILSDYDKGNK
jgi:hypothetical protein